MFVALADHLRCTEPHAATWLVARADEMDGRQMVTGVLGCPACRVEREVRSRVVWWTRGGGAAPARSPAADADHDAVVRVGALLGYTDSAAPYVLGGGEALAAAGLGGLAGAPLILLDPPDDRAASLATIIRGAPRMPLAPGSVRGIVLDNAHVAAEFVASAVVALARGGRLVLPAAQPVPAGIRELARDATHWVGEREADVVAIGRAAPR